MKLTVVAMETPYPAIHGGRIDIWRRIVALNKLGIKVQLVSWNYKSTNQKDYKVIQDNVHDFYEILYKSGVVSRLSRAIDLLQYPLQVTSRISRGQEREILLARVKAFEPDVIIADHIHCGLLAQDLSQTLKIPYVVRSHDIEHLHYRDWLQAAQGLEKLKLSLALLHLKDYEYSVLSQSKAFYDISIDDLHFWEEHGLKNGRFLPPLADFSAQSRFTSDAGQETLYDVVFLGNLRTENNVSGVLWFLNQVLPKLKEAKSDISVLIAGSNPVRSIIYRCQAITGVTLLPNPTSASTTYHSGRVLINPISVGSGTSIKSIDMLTCNRPIITLEKGLSGLPQQARSYFMLASDSESFSELILKALDSVDFNQDRNQEIQDLFGLGSIHNFVNDLEKLIAS